MATFDNGYIKIYRKILDWEWYSDINTRIVFLHCLLKANWKDKKWKGVEVKRGAFVSSLRHLSREIGISERSLRTALAHLELTHEVTQSSFVKYTVFTVVHYDEYQATDTVTDTQNDTKVTHKSTQETPADRQATDTLPTTTKEYKEREEEKKKIKIPEGTPKSAVLVENRDEWKKTHSYEDGWRIDYTEVGMFGYRIRSKKKA